MADALAGPRHPPCDPTNLDVIFAEDELVFREIAVPEIINAGISKTSLHVAEDGFGAFELFEKLKDGASTPLLMILDVRMPGMDGKQCAQKVKERVAEKALAREPFMVCCSAEVRKVSYEDKNGVFNIILP